MGKLTLDAILARDFPTIQVVVLVIVLLYLVNQYLDRSDVRLSRPADSVELMSTLGGAEAAILAQATQRHWRLPRVLRNARVLMGGTTMVVLLIVAIFAPEFAPFSPIKPDCNGVKAPPSWHHLLGQDQIGRDLLSRAIYGTRTAFEVGALVLTIAVATGVIIGMAAGLAGGWTDRFIGVLVDTTLAFPSIVLALAVTAAVVAATLGGTVIFAWSVTIALIEALAFSQNLTLDATGQTVGLSGRGLMDLAIVSYRSTRHRRSSGSALRRR